MSDSKRNRYVLDYREDEEVSRLGLQHDVWRDHTMEALALGGFKRGDVVADLGAGPGYVCFELADIVGPEGKVIGVERSEKFNTFITETAAARKLPNVVADNQDLAKLELRPESLDGAFVRWVLMFLGDPEKTVGAVARALRPGAAFVAWEYMSFRMMSLFPRSETFDRVFDGVYQLISDAGGDPDVGGKIPEMMRRQGLEVRHLHPVLRIGRPGSPLWRWFDANNRLHTNLVEGALIVAKDLEGYYTDWNARSENPAAFFCPPPVLVTVGVKP